MSEIREHSEMPEKSIGAEAKRNYWDKFAKQHIPEMRVLFRGGKLGKKDGWRNVIEHSLPQGAAAEILSDLLQLPETEKEELIKNAICHDWDKRLEKNPDDFTNDDQEKALNLIKAARLNPRLLEATKPDFIEQVIVAEKSGEKIPITQLLIFYIDSITLGSGDDIGGFVSFKTRLAEAQPRYPELSPEHWDNEIRANHIVENKICELLKGKGVLIEKPEDIHLLITNVIEKNIEKSAGDCEKND